MQLIDVNILVYALNQRSPHHKVVYEWWQSALTSGQPIALTWAVLVGFARLATLPRVMPRPLSVPQAVGEIQGWLRHPNTLLVSEADNHDSLLFELLTEAGRGGNLVTDAHLAALAIGNGAALASCDTDFARFSKLRWVNPLAA
ncbi:MAG: type II toxin-antitoxin system VapC family toxin [Planctomycetota bacterium]